MLGQQIPRKIVRKVGRFLIKAFLSQPLPKPYVHEKGLAWSARLPGLRHLADCPEANSQSPLLLFDNGLALPIAHTEHSELRLMGAGRYSHWEDKVFFSLIDNSNPNTNGRAYSYSISPWLYRRHKPHALPPMNFRKRIADAQTLREDVAYALQVGRGYREWLQGTGVSLAGKQVLEVGPGINLGSVLYLACLGAIPLVTDRFLAGWDTDYHLPLYTLLRDRLRQEEPALEVKPINAILAAHGYPESILVRRECALETLEFPDNSIDLVFSNAVVEHLWDILQSVQQLVRVTRPGGWGFHQVDFRFHGDFNRPLDHLLLSREEFRKMFVSWHAASGTSLRPAEVTQLFREGGFEVEFSGNLQVAPDYLKEFLPRLRSTPNSPYCHFPVEELQVLGGLLRVRKPS